jgi:peptidoglycan/LPS O-acetylase OafA/YrhL
MTIAHHPKTQEIYSHTGLRGIAAFAVMAGHLIGWKFAVIGSLESSPILSSLFGWLDYAVDLFFMLSGFILNWVYFNPNKPIHWKSYSIARIARITPLYFLTLFVFIPNDFFSIFRHGMEYVHSYYPIVLITNLTMSSGFFLGSAINAPAWSVSVEMLLYFTLFPILCLLARNITHRKNSDVIYLISCVTLMFILLKVYQHHGFKFTSSSGLEIKPECIMRGVCSFPIGFIVCIWFRKFHHLLNSKIAITCFIGLFFIVFIASRLAWIPSASALAIFPFMIFLTAFDKGAFSNLLKLTPFQWLGERSYSIYLWHFPIICLASFLLSKAASKTNYSALNNCYFKWVFLGLVVIASLLISEASYRYFEVPSRQYIRKIS